MLFGCGRAKKGFLGEAFLSVKRDRQECLKMKARTSMVDGFPYKEEVGGSSPSVPTISSNARRTDLLVCRPVSDESVLLLITRV